MHPAIIIGTVRSLIVDVAMGQIPRSTERISSLFIHSFIRSLIQSVIHSFVHPFIHSSNYLFRHLFSCCNSKRGENTGIFVPCAVIDPGHGWIWRGGHRSPTSVVLLVTWSADPEWWSADRRRISVHLESNPQTREDHQHRTESKLWSQCPWRLSDGTQPRKGCQHATCSH